jgi:hypothetical protein
LGIEEIGEEEGSYGAFEETPPTFGVPTRALLGSPVEKSPRHKKQQNQAVQKIESGGEIVDTDAINKRGERPKM